MFSRHSPVLLVGNDDDDDDYDAMRMIMMITINVAKFNNESFLMFIKLHGS